MPERFDANIRKLPLFANLPQQHLEWARDAMRIMRVEPGEAIFNQGDQAQGLYMFISGQGRLVRQNPDGGTQVLGVVGPNQYLNEAALFRKSTESATLEATQTATVLFVSRRELSRVVSYHPEMKEFIPVPVEAVRQQQRERIFKGQRDSEDVLLDTRRHPWVMARRAWLPAIIGLVLIIIAVIMPAVALSLACGGLAIVVPGALMVYYYLEWRNDHFIITDQRIVRIEQEIHTFQTNISEIPLSSIQQINADLVTSDPFSRVFNYGTVDIRTAGDAGNIKLTLIPDPNGVQDIIFANRGKYRQQAEREHRNTIRAEVDKVMGLGSSDPQAEGEMPFDQTPPPAASNPGFFAQKYIAPDGSTIYRKHITLYVRDMVLPVTLAFVGMVLLLLSGALGIGAIGIVIALVLFPVSILWGWWNDWDWRNDYYSVGDEMIQLVHKRPLFLQNEDDQILLERVDNVTSRRSGLLPAMLNYGDVTIALIGGDRGDEKVFRAVKDPSGVQAEITRRQSRFRSKEQIAEEKRRRDEIAEYLSVYHETVQAQQGGATRQVDLPSQQPQSPQSGSTPSEGNRPPNIPRRRPPGES